MTGVTREIEFVGTLGSGGFGVVYLANLHGRDRFVRRVAVKLLHEGAASPETVARQRDEARLLGLLAHENIVQVLELTEISGRPAVVMEYVQGLDLSAALAEGRTLPPRACLEVARAVASALEAAWSSPSPMNGEPLRVIHRDIKPANILLTPSGGVKVLDFGIARGNFLRDAQTRSAMWGTPRYMAPELWLEMGWGEQVDTYALGLTLLDMLKGLRTDRPPLEEGRHQRYVDEALSGIEPAIAALLRDMLSFESKGRPSHAQLCQRINQLLAEMSGESLAIYAHRELPQLLAHRAENSIPPTASGRITLDAPAAKEVLEKLSIPPPARGEGTLQIPKPDTGLKMWWMLALASTIAIILLSVTVLLGAGAWLWQSKTQTPPSQSQVTPNENQFDIEAEAANNLTGPCEMGDGSYEQLEGNCTLPQAQISSTPKTVPKEAPKDPPKDLPKDPPLVAQEDPQKTRDMKPPAPIHVAIGALAPIPLRVVSVYIGLGSKITVDKKIQCNSPCSLQLPPGSHSFHNEGMHEGNPAVMDCTLEIPANGADTVSITKNFCAASCKSGNCEHRLSDNPNTNEYRRE